MAKETVNAIGSGFEDEAVTLDYLCGHKVTLLGGVGTRGLQAESDIQKQKLRDDVM